VNQRLDETGDEVRAAIEEAAALDVSYLPEDYREDFEDAIENARESFEAIEEIERLEAEKAEAAGDYAPLHEEVRAVQREIRDRRARVEELETEIRRGFGDVEAMERTVERLRSEIEALEAEIPEGWAEAEREFGQITSGLRRARLTYRRTVDQAYEPVAELIGVIETTDALAAIGEPLRALREDLRSLEGDAGAERFQEVERALGDVEGAREIRGLVADARRDVDSRSPDYDAAADYLDEAVALFESQLDWRRRAQEELLPGLRAYEEAIDDTIGLRQQPRMPREVALFVASCEATHRDISLNF
jgi:chromosome segregation ATPase